MIKNSSETREIKTSCPILNLKEETQECKFYAFTMDHQAGIQ